MAKFSFHFPFCSLSFLEYGVPTYDSLFSLSRSSELYCVYQMFQIQKTNVLISHINTCSLMHLSYEKVKRSQDTIKSYSKRAVLKMQRKKNRTMLLQCCLQHNLLFGSAVCSGTASEGTHLVLLWKRISVPGRGGGTMISVESPVAFLRSAC